MNNAHTGGGTSPLTSPPPGEIDDQTSMSLGLAAGFGIGVLVWVLYFVQASVLDGPFWDVTVVPADITVAVLGAGVALRRRDRRRFWAEPPVA
jgi:hypothetical protein